MQTENRLFDDLARVASGAFNTLGSVREEIETRVRERVERMANDLDLVSREDFDAVKTMASEARREQDRLAARVIRLEDELAALAARLEAQSRPEPSEEPGPSQG